MSSKIFIRFIYRRCQVLGAQPPAISIIASTFLSVSIPRSLCMSGSSLSIQVPLPMLLQHNLQNSDVFVLVKFAPNS